MKSFGSNNRQRDERFVREINKGMTCLSQQSQLMLSDQELERRRERPSRGFDGHEVYGLEEDYPLLVWPELK